MSQFATRQVTRVQSSTWCVALVWYWCCCFSRWAQRRGRSQQQPWRGLYISASGLYIFRSQHVQVNIPSISCLSSSEPPIHRSGIDIVLRQSGSLHRELRYNGDSLQRLYSDTTERSKFNSIPSDDDDPDKQPAATSDGLAHVVDTGNRTRLQSFLDAIVRVKREFTACGGIEVQGTYGESVPSVTNFSSHPPIVPSPPTPCTTQKPKGLLIP